MGGSLAAGHLLKPAQEVGSVLEGELLLKKSPDPLGVATLAKVQYPECPFDAAPSLLRLRNEYLDDQSNVRIGLRHQNVGGARAGLLDGSFRCSTHVASPDQDAT